LKQASVLSLRRQLGQPVQRGAQGVLLFRPAVECFGAMKGEEAARSGLGIAEIGESDDLAGAEIDKGEFFVIEIFYSGFCIVFSLIFMSEEFVAFFFAFGLDDAGRPAMDEEEIVRWAGISEVLVHRYAKGGMQVDLGFVLNHPTEDSELPVDVIAGDLFWGLIHFCCARLYIPHKWICDGRFEYRV